MTKIQELETYFTTYPDVPKEVTIKEDCLRLGLNWTKEAQEASQGYQRKSYYIFQFDRSSRSDMEKESLTAPEEIKIFGGQYKLRDTLVANRLAIDSPYLLDLVNGKLQLCDRSEGSGVNP